MGNPTPKKTITTNTIPIRFPSLLQKLPAYFLPPYGVAAFEAGEFPGKSGSEVVFSLTDFLEKGDTALDKVEVEQDAYRCGVETPQGGEGVRFDQPHKCQPEKIEPAEESDRDAAAEDQGADCGEDVADTEPEILCFGCIVDEGMVADVHVHRGG